VSFVTVLRTVFVLRSTMRVCGRWLPRIVVYCFSSPKV
jgi:hypothetical protein